MWLRKAVKQKVYILSNDVSTVLLISANNPDLFMALKAMVTYFFEALCNGTVLVGVCLCLLWNKGS